jgi:hypothetical protein
MLYVHGCVHLFLIDAGKDGSKLSNQASALNGIRPIMSAPTGGPDLRYFRQTGPELVARAEVAYLEGRTTDAEYMLGLAYEAYDLASNGGVDDRPL